MRQFALLLVLILVCTPVLTAVAAPLPIGEWREDDALGTVYVLLEDTSFTAEQLRELGMTLPEGLAAASLPKGFSLTIAEMEQIFSGDLSDLPAVLAPALSFFSLTGDWRTDEGGALWYRHTLGDAWLSFDDVVAALAPDAGLPEPGHKIYLTIDDTPGQYTMDLLAMLKLLNVRATFFILGANVNHFPDSLRAIYNEGHVLANHSHSHAADTLNSSAAACIADFRFCQTTIERVLGFPVSMPIVRIPYGSSTIPSAYKSAMVRAGYAWIDWNALNGDTESSIDSDDAALKRAFTTAARYNGDIVMLVHDGKKRTIRTMPQLVQHFRDLGYTFDVLTTDLADIKGVRMGGFNGQ